MPPDVDEECQSVNGPQAAEDEPLPPRFVKWRLVVVVTLLLMYTGYYFNRSNVSVATPQILEDTGLNKTDFGTVLSVGYGVYAIGKFTNGVLIDFFGGRPMFLIGLAGSALATVAFTFCSDIPGFTVTWSINRYLQSMGWGALVKITSRWFGAKEYGRIMGIMSLSYMFGDAIIRLIYGQLLNAGLSWQGLFYVAAAVAVAMLIPGFFTLKNSPKDIGEKEPASGETNVYSKERQEGQDLTLKELLLPLALSPKFWALVVLSALLTLIRETFNSWTPVYLEEELGLSPGDAATASMVFPLAGTASAILGGFLVDRVPKKWRGGVPLGFLILLSCTLAGLSAFAKFFKGEGPGAVALCLFMIGMTAFFLIAPYSFLDGVFTLDLAGKQGCAATASIINGAGYLGAILSGVVTGLAADGKGWPLVFVILTMMSLVSMAFQGIYWGFDVRDARKEPEAQGLLSPS